MEFAVEVTVPRIPLTDGSAPGVVHEEMLRAAEVSVALLQGSIVPRVPVDRGFARQGVQASVTGEGVDVTGRVFDPVAYAVPLEAGSQPHFPPTDAIAGWVRRKGIASDEREVRSVAFLIARAISRRGTRARNFFRDGVAEAGAKVRARFAAVPGLILRRLGGGN